MFIQLRPGKSDYLLSIIPVVCRRMLAKLRQREKDVDTLAYPLDFDSAIVLLTSAV